MTKYLTLFIIVALALLSFLTVRFSKDTYKMLPIDLKKTENVDLTKFNFQEWKEYHSPSGAFTVLLPTLPQHATESIKDPKTGNIRNYDMYVSERIDGTIFMISLITFQDLSSNSDPETLLLSMMNDMVASNPDNVLKAEQTGSFQGHPSLDFTMSNNEHHIDAKTFMIDNIMFVLTRISNAKNYNTSEYTFFINSFEVANQK